MRPSSRPAFLVTVFVVSSLTLACGGSTTGPTNDPGGSSTAATSGGSCQELGASARTEVDAVVRANLACSADADCVDIGFGASCFDSCTRAVNKTKIAAIDAAKAKVNAAQCARFKDQGCKLIVPPCAPPEPPACREGRCR